jgi:hypothetical protein
MVGGGGESAATARPLLRRARASACGEWRRAEMQDALRWPAGDGCGRREEMVGDQQRDRSARVKMRCSGAPDQTRSLAPPDFAGTPPVWTPDGDLRPRPLIAHSRRARAPRSDALGRGTASAAASRGAAGMPIALLEPSLGPHAEHRRLGELMACLFFGPAPHVLPGAATCARRVCTGAGRQAGRDGVGCGRRVGGLGGLGERVGAHAAHQAQRRTMARRRSGRAGGEFERDGALEREQ